MTATSGVVNKLTQYLNNSMSPYHVIEYSKEVLDNAGFKQLDFNQQFELEAGSGYYCIPYPTALFAFKIGNEIKNGKMHIACAHTDSPCFKIKPVPEMGAKANARKINVEPYGGALKRTWFDRPLGVAGQLVVRGDNTFSPKKILFDSEASWLLIPSLAPHMDRDIEEKKIDVQKELIPIYSFEENCDENSSFIKAVANKAGVAADDILSFDLGLYVRDKATLCGLNEEFILSPRIDNVGSVAALVESMISEAECKEDDNDISMIALFDNEEIGSRTKQGADSMIFSWIIDRIYAADAFKNIDKPSALAGSYMLSVDGAHAVHPNYAEKADETSRAYIGKGIVLKTSASQRYVSDAGMTAIIRQLCGDNDIAVQLQANRSGIPGGQTLGPIESSFLPIPAADMGIPMLAMHSCVETASVADYKSLLCLMKIWNA